MRASKALASALALILCGEARADAVILSCWGTVALLQAGKQINPKDERYSVVITVDLTSKTLTVDDGMPWQLNGDTSGMVVAAIGPNKGHVTLNRITGAVTVHTIRDDGLLQFHGMCKSAQKLF